MSNKDKIDDIFDLVRSGIDLIDEHEDKLNNILNSSQDSIRIDDRSPLTSFQKSEDEVTITVETKEEFESISISKSGGEVTISLNDKDVVADVPRDVDIKQVDANLNNGVLDVNIPREGE